MSSSVQSDVVDIEVSTGLIACHLLPATAVRWCHDDLRCDMAPVRGSNVHAGWGIVSTLR